MTTTGRSLGAIGLEVPATALAPAATGLRARATGRAVTAMPLMVRAMGPRRAATRLGARTMALWGAPTDRWGPRTARKAAEIAAEVAAIRRTASPASLGRVIQTLVVPWEPLAVAAGALRFPSFRSGVARTGLA